MTSGRVVFLGTSEFAVPSLEALVAGGESVALVVTQPDRPRGRGRQLVFSPVKSAALRLGLSVFQPESVNAPDAARRLVECEPEFLAVVAYGQILAPSVLSVPRRSAVNLHASLLPRHRGPSPACWTILCGDPNAGNTTMVMEEGLDSGPILLQESFPLGADTTRGELEARLSRSGGALLLATLRGLRSGGLSAVSQDGSRATWSRLITREVRTLDWREGAQRLRRLVLALAPAPGAVARHRGRLLKVLRADASDGVGVPGEVIGLGDGAPVVACGGGALILREVQPEGKRPMSGEDFARGGGMRVGDRIEVPEHG